MFNQQQIDGMVKAIVSTVQPVSIILFGSYARGDTRQGSDIDLLIVEREGFGKARSRWKEISRIRRAVTDFKGAKDILVYSRDEAALLRESMNHVVSDAFRHGKVLYEG